MTWKLACGMMLLFLVGCDVERDYEDYNIRSDDDLILTELNHPHGFRQNRCFYCHVKANIHQVDRYGSALFDTAKYIVDTEGLSGCFICHGDNGVP